MASAAVSGGVGGAPTPTAKPHGGTLFLVPPALMCQWKAEVARHAPSLSCCIIHTNQSGEIITQTDELQEASTDEWVACDECGKWRRVPEAVVAGLGDDDKWHCSDNPDRAFASCKVEEEEEYDPDTGAVEHSSPGGGIHSLPLPRPPPPLSPRPPSPSSLPSPAEGSAAWLASFDVVICSHAVLTKLPWHGGGGGRGGSGSSGGGVVGGAGSGRQAERKPQHPLQAVDW